MTITVSWLAVLVMMAPAIGGPVAAQDDDAEGEQNDPGQALVRVIHASPDAPALDLFAGDQIVASGLVSGDVTGFLPVPDGNVDLHFVPAGGAPETAIVEVRFDLADGGIYEVVALGQLREIDGQVYEIDRTRFETPGKARVRVLHLSPDADQIDVLLNDGDPLFEGVDFADATGYEEVDAGGYPLALRSSDPAIVASGGGGLAAMDVTFAEGGVYDILAVGRLEEATFGILPLEMTSDLPCGDLLGAGGLGDACVRVVHVSPDTPVSDFYLDDATTPLVEGIGFAEASGFVPVLAGEHRVRVVEAGQAPESALREGTIELQAGTAYNLATVDLREQLELTVTALDLSPLGAGQARLRLAHAMPNQTGITLAGPTGEPLLAEVTFPEVSEAREVPAGPLALEVHSAADAELVFVPEATLELTPGLVYTLYAIGATEDGTARLLPLTAVAATASGAAPPTPEA